MYVIGTTRHPENISNSKRNILFTIGFQTAINHTENVIAYTLVVSEKSLGYDIVRNDIKDV